MKLRLEDRKSVEVLFIWIGLIPKRCKLRETISQLFASLEENKTMNKKVKEKFQT